MEWIDDFLKRNFSETLKHNSCIQDKLLETYVYRSLKHESVGVTDKYIVGKIIQNKTLDDGTSSEFRNTLGFIEAYDHLHKLSGDRDGGLLENNLICEVHKILMKYHKNDDTAGKYSVKDRIAEFDGSIHYYSSHHHLESEMQALIDKYNSKWDAINRHIRGKDDVKSLEELIRLLTWLVYTFLEIHPFSDANGRMIRLLYTYIMEAYGFPFQLPLLWFNENEPSSLYNREGEDDYRKWCKLLWNARVTKDLAVLEDEMIRSLKLYCQDYEHFIKGYI